MIRTDKLLYFTNRDEWRAWLEENHATQAEAWLVQYKKHVVTPGVPYEEAVEEALCFGWIDGVMKSIDGDKFALRYSPRKRKSIWSESNKERVKRLTEQGKMTEAGLAKVREAQENGEWEQATLRENPAEFPADLKEALAANEQARQNFEELSPSTQKRFIWWITNARQEATRKRRVEEIVRLALENKLRGRL
jgi:uncharacterized protein YdeI (YjbR/CyaY-like superfamily)